MNGRLFLIICGMFLFSCNENRQPEPDDSKNETQSETYNFEWLVGQWKRSNEEKGKETFENWVKTSDVEYNGIGFTMRNNDTISQEKMTIAQSDSGWVMAVKMPDEKEPTIFKLTEFTNDKFVCVNESNEFPKRIEYWKNDNKLNAAISGGDLKIPFEFERVK